MCGDRVPFQIFPGIFNRIDSYSKKITLRHFRQHGRMPKWFNGFGELGKPIPVPHWLRFQMLDPETNILLTGVPDEILRHPNQGIWIGDYKTARFTDTQDTLVPMYEAQLNSYALIAEKIGLGSVRGLGLLYYEPVTDLIDPADDFLVQDDCFFMRFSPKLKPVNVEPDIIPPLLRQVREICDRAESPPGRSGCRDCTLLESLIRGSSGASRSLKEDLIRSLDAQSHRRLGKRAQPESDGAYDI